MSALTILILVPVGCHLCSDVCFLLFWAGLAHSLLLYDWLKSSFTVRMLWIAGKKAMTGEGYNLLEFNEILNGG
jgi:hypothetical protein